MKKVCICGGGNLGHVVTGFLAANGDCEVSLLTRHPDSCILLIGMTFL